MANPISRLTIGLADHYRLGQELGRGGMATVYLAHDLKHERDVAIKVLRPELAAILGRQRFLNEIRLTAKLDHPHILTLIDSGETDGVLWYVLPFIRGESLRARLQRERQLAVDTALAITRQIAGALDYAHRQGVIHRDIKPENILLHEGEAMLADFGIALAVQQAGGRRLTETGLSLGTPEYMSPEQASGDRDLDGRSDVYSLGAVTYEMLAGEPPHTGATVQAVIVKLLHERPIPLGRLRDTVPPGVDAAVARALAKVPADRFSGAKEFAAALRAEPGTESSTRVLPATAVSAPRPHRRRLVWAGIGLVVLAVAGVSLFREASRGPPTAAATPVKLTSSGDITAAALSPDGTRLATSARECDSAGRCTYALALRDLGGAGELKLVERLGSVLRIQWSPEARYLLFQGTDGAGRFGVFRVGVLGGAVRYVGCCVGHFLSSGDTVMLATENAARIRVLRVITPADGRIHDSIVSGKQGFFFLGTPSPDGKRIAELVSDGPTTSLVILDREGTQLDSTALTSTIEDRPTWDPDGSAVILKAVASEGSALAHLERVPVNRQGGLGTPAVIEGVTVTDLEEFSIAGPSRALIYLSGGQEQTVSALTRRSPDTSSFRSRLLRRSTGDLAAGLSPDGRFVFLLSRPPDSPRRQGSILPFESGPEIAIPAPSDGEVLDATWTWDGSRLLYLVRGSAPPDTVYSFGLASGRARAVGPFERGLQAVGPNLLALLGDSAIVLTDTNLVELRRLPDPDRSEGPGWVYASPDGESLVTLRWSTGFDVILISRVSLEDGRRQRLGELRIEAPAGMFSEPDGSIQIAVLETLGTLAFYRLDRRGGPPVRLGSEPAEGAVSYTYSRDGRRAIKVESRPRGDVWMIRNFDGQVQR
jgi:dipeptidyl aminopeptidase/acylaminoacyl peptidase